MLRACLPSIQDLDLISPGHQMLLQSNRTSPSVTQNKIVFSSENNDGKLYADYEVEDIKPEKSKRLPITEKKISNKSVNMTLPAFAAEPVLRRRCCRAPAPAIDRYLWLIGCSAANLPHAAAAVDRWDRQMDMWTLHRFIDPALHTVQAVSIKI